MPAPPTVRPGITDRKRWADAYLAAYLRCDGDALNLLFAEARSKDELLEVLARDVLDAACSLIDRFVPIHIATAALSQRLIQHALAGASS